MFIIRILLKYLFHYYDFYLFRWFDQIEITKEHFADTILNEIELLQLKNISFWLEPGHGPNWFFGLVKKSATQSYVILLS